VAQLNSALDYGSRGFWFESRQGHKKAEKHKKKRQVLLSRFFMPFRFQSGALLEGRSQSSRSKATTNKKEHQ
jgi:hypothetical protein